MVWIVVVTFFTDLTGKWQKVYEFEDWASVLTTLSVAETFPSVQGVTLYRGEKVS